jgi:hypothetical protein
LKFDLVQNQTPSTFSFASSADIAARPNSILYIGIDLNLQFNPRQKNWKLA